MTPIKSSTKSNENEVYDKIRDKRTKRNPELKTDDLVRTSRLYNTLDKRDTTNWSYHLCKITKVLENTNPRDYLETFPERTNEAFLKKTILIKRQNDNLIKKLKLKK